MYELRERAWSILFGSLLYLVDFIPDSIGQKSAPKKRTEKGPEIFGPFFNAIELPPRSACAGCRSRWRGRGRPRRRRRGSRGERIDSDWSESWHGFKKTQIWVLISLRVKKSLYSNITQPISDSDSKDSSLNPKIHWLRQIDFLGFGPITTGGGIFCQNRICARKEGRPIRAKSVYLMLGSGFWHLVSDWPIFPGDSNRSIITDHLCSSLLFQPSNRILSSILPSWEWFSHLLGVREK